MTASFATRTISGVEVDCTPLPEYPRGALLLADLTYIAMPALTELGSSLAGGLDLSMKPADLAKVALSRLGPNGAGKLIGALEGSMRRLLREDPATAQRLIGELLSGCTVTVPKEGGGAARVDLNTPAKIQLALSSSGGGYGLLFRLLAFALEVNYGGFFGAASAGTSREARPVDAPTRTP